MSELILAEEDFKLGLLDRVPVPNPGECFLLYQEGAGESNSMIISSGGKYSAVGIIHKHYNKKIVISLQSQKVQHKQYVSMNDKGFYFEVTVCITYKIRDVRRYFFGTQVNGDDLTNMIKDILYGEDGKWDIDKWYMFQQVVENELNKVFKRCDGVDIRIDSVKVELDDVLKKMQESDRDTQVKLHVGKNETIVKQQESENQHKIKMQRTKEFQDLTQAFGELAPIVGKYIDGEMDPERFYAYIEEFKEKQKNSIKEAFLDDIISQEEADLGMRKIIGENIMQIDQRTDRQTREIDRISEANNKKEEAVMDEDVVIDEEVGDGDYI